MLVEAVREPLEGIRDAHLEGAQALGVALQGYRYRRCIIEEVVEEGPPAGCVGFRVSPSRCHDISEMILTSIFFLPKVMSLPIATGGRLQTTIHNPAKGFGTLGR